MIKYSNFIGITSETEFTLFTHSGDLPQINLIVKPYYFVYESIKISVSVGNLDEDKTKYLIQLYEIDKKPKKSISSGLNISTETNPFQISKYNLYSLKQFYAYTFQVSAKNLNSNQIQNQIFTIDIPFSGLICNFNNQGIQSIRKDLNLLIECKDLDTRYEWNKDPDLNIQVSCYDLSLNRTCQNQQKQIINVNKTDFFQYIKKNTIPAYNVQKWTVNVQKFEQTSQSDLIIVYLDNYFPQLELQYNEGYLMRKINNYEKLNFTFIIPVYQKAYLLDLSITIIYNYEIIEIQKTFLNLIIIQPKYVSYSFKIFDSIKELNYGDSVNLKFTAQYTNNIINLEKNRDIIINSYIMPSLNNKKLSINQPPSCSKLYITRPSDLALTNIQIATTCLQSDDFPYKYQLRIFLREMHLKDFLEGSSDYSLILQPFQNLNQFSIQTPSSVVSSKIGILLQVLDSRGSIAQLSETVRTKPAKLNCSLIQFENLNLQSKILLLFEALNQKCDQVHHQIYLNLLKQQIFTDSNDNILKFQAIKLYKELLITAGSNQTQNRILTEDTPNRENLVNYTAISTEQDVNLTQKIEEFQENINNLNKTLQNFIRMKKEIQEDVDENYFIWNEELSQQQQNCEEGLKTLLQLIRLFLSY